MRLLNLFDGIGGFALAAEWMGWKNVGSCEIDPFCRRVLNYHFKYAYIYDDIKQADFTPLKGQIDIITGGFPCQPFSCAGERRGKDDNRYLWPEMLRAIREVSPRWVVAENVRGLLSIEKGMVFEQVCLDLEDAGYEVQPFVIPAVAVDAPHRRDRVWFVAHAKSDGSNRIARSESGTDERQNTELNAQPFEYGGVRIITDNQVVRQQWRLRDRCAEGRERPVLSDDKGRDEMGREPARCGGNGASTDTEFDRRNESEFYDERTLQPQENQGRPCQEQPFGADSAQGWWRNFPTESPICGRNDGLPRELVGITFSKWREQSVKAYGNAIVPQVALQIFRAIEDIETKTQ